MTGYQKLKKENEMLWEWIEKLLLEKANSDHTEENIKDIIQKEIAWMKWKIEHETNQEKN